ncbi:MAG TPA: hypothetical protein VK826_16095 [Bacteroidia bacterium]|nr:hypothetical protein [Bacteroidia bacterium]
MKHIIRSIFPLLVAAFVFGNSGCSVFDPAEEIPSYVRISSISFTTNGTTEGTNSSKITDAWIYVDGQLIGGFEMPCTVPILAEGTHTILVLAGIKQNGLSSTRAIYPYFKGWESTITLTRGQVLQLSPAVIYYPQTNFLWMCDFDQAGTNIDDAVSAGATWDNLLQEVGAPDAFETESGFARLNSDTFQFYARSSLPYTLDASFDIYLEMNYRSNQNFTIGIYNTVTSQYVPWVDVTASTSWNKIYIRLNDAVLTQPPNGNYHVYIAMKKAADVSNPYLYFDELKLIN